MYARLIMPIFLFAGSLYAEQTISFNVAGRRYQLTGAQAMVSEKRGKVQVILGARDLTQKTMVALTAEVPKLEGPVELSSEYNAVSLMIMNNKGVYSIAPHTTLARDDFMRYTKRTEVETGQLEDDPEDKPEDRIEECRREHRFDNNREKHLQRFSDDCKRQMREQRRKRKKMRAVYSKEGPTWVNKSRSARIASGDGIVRERKYRNSSFFLQLTPVMANGRIKELQGSFAGVVVYNEGSGAALDVPLQSGTFTVPVTYGH